MIIDALVAGLAAVRSILRAPFVNLRLLVDTPDAWAPALAAVLLLVLAWWRDRREPARRRSEWFTYSVAGLLGFGFLLWLFHAGQCPWIEGDWREEWTFFIAWKQALHAGRVPYYLHGAMQGTERYLANLQTPMMPYVWALALVDVRAFFLLHIAIVYGVGFLGLVALSRELELGLLPWTMFVLLFALNGHIVSHLSVGHLPWVAYFLLPWVLLFAVRTSRGEESRRHVAACAATFAGMILIGGWHVFIWSLLFFAIACLVSLRRLTVLARVGVITALLAAARLAPAFVTYGGGTNIFVGGYPTAVSVLTGLVGAPASTPMLEPWEFDSYIGSVGLLLLALGAIPFRDAAKRPMNVLLLSSAALVVLSIGNVYGRTLFRLPGFVSERVTSRLLVVPVLWLAVAGCIRVDSWYRRSPRSLAASVAVLLGACFLAVQLVLRSAVWRPHDGGALDNLPLDAIKMIPVERGYFWAFWCGLVISVVSTLALAASVRRPSGQTPR